MTKTNFQLLRSLLTKYTPKNWGILSEEEKELIETELQLIGATELELRNMRDFVVEYFSTLYHKDGHNEVNSDKLSAITYVIDNALFYRGCEV